MNYKKSKFIKLDKNLTEEKLRLFSMFLLTFFVLLDFLIIVYTLNKGFDLSDEGYYMLSNKYPIGAKSTNDLLFLTIDNVFYMRLLRFVLTVTSSLFFSCHFIKFLEEKNNVNKIIIYLFLQCGALCSYSIFPLTLSYNSFPLILGLFCGGLVLFFLRRRNFFSLIFIGVLVGWWFIVKMPSAVLFLFIMSSFLFFLNNKVETKLILWYCGLFGGFILFIFIYFLLINPFDGWIENFKSLASTSHHNPYKLFNYYLRNFIRLFLSYIPFAVSSIFFWLSFGLREKDNYLILKTTLVLVSFLGFLILNFYFKTYIGGHTNYKYHLIPYFSTILLFIIGDLISHKESIFKNRIHLLLILFFIAIPFILSFGSNNPIYLNSFQYVVFWMAILVFFHDRISKITYSIFTIMLLLILEVQIYTGLYKFPYRVLQPFEQKYELENTTTLNRIKLDKDTKNLVDSCNIIIKTKTNFKEKDNIIALYSLAGLVYLLKGYSPGVHIYHLDYLKENAEALARTNIPLSRLIIIKQKDIPINDYLLAALRKKRLNFPIDFKEIGSVNDQSLKGRFTVFATKDILK